MSKIKMTSTPALYQTLRDASFASREANDCSVVAVAAVCGVDYAKAHFALKARGRKDRRGAYPSDILDACYDLGFTTKIIPPRTFIDRYPGVHKNLHNVTTHHPRRFPGVFDPAKRYLLFTRRHVLAVVGGEVNDWTINKAKHVTSIHEISPK